MGTKYSTQTATGYNASPPSDDGTAVASNEVKWDIIKPKLADPVKDLADNINSNLLTHIDESVLDKATAYTTTAADHKRTINVTAAATQSLGDAATMAVGYIVTIKNSHTAAITVDLATGADTLDGTAAGSISLGPNNSATFVTNAAADGYLQSENADPLFVKDYSETASQYTATTGTRDLDLSVATYFYPSADLGAATITFTFSNPVASGRVASFTLELLGADGAAITWPTSVDWPSGFEPTWTSGVDIVSFLTRDGGTTWLGLAGGFSFS